MWEKKSTQQKRRNKKEKEKEKIKPKNYHIHTKRLVLPPPKIKGIKRGTMERENQFLENVLLKREREEREKEFRTIFSKMGRKRRKVKKKYKHLPKSHERFSSFAKRREEKRESLSKNNFTQKGSKI